MRYEVPQFIEIEDKIVGPLSWKQFVYVAGGAGACFVAYVWLPSFLAYIVIAPIALLAAALAFYKVNQRPFLLFLESLVMYYFNNKLYLWKKREGVVKEKSIEQEVEEMVNPTAHQYVPKLSDSKLKDLSWALDIEEKRTGEVL